MQQQIFTKEVKYQKNYFSFMEMNRFILTNITDPHKLLFYTFSLLSAKD